MPSPSQLEIATSAVLRLLKEELSYRKELVDQAAELKKQEEKLKADKGVSEDGNGEFLLKQQQLALEQTRAVFEPLGKRIDQAVDRLEELVEGATPDQAEAAVKAQAVLAQAKAAKSDP